jgi:hypothetical protein
VLQIARGHYAPDAFHEYIGFQVSQSLLEQAFEETYALDLKSIFPNYDLAIGSYRRGVSEVIPEMTKVAWQMKKDDIQKDIPGITRQKFLYHLSRSDYEKNWDTKYEKPDFWARLIALFTRLVPKVGPFKALAFQTPTPDTEKMFMASFNGSIEQYETSIRAERNSGHADLLNDNFDTGTVTGPGQYPLADKTYAELLDRLAKQNFQQVSPALQAAVLGFYGDLKGPFATKKNKKEWAKVVVEVGQLRAFTPVKTGP